MKIIIRRAWNINLVHPSSCSIVWTISKLQREKDKQKKKKKDGSAKKYPNIVDLLIPSIKIFGLLKGQNNHKVNDQDDLNKIQYIRGDSVSKYPISLRTGHQDMEVTEHDATLKPFSSNWLHFPWWDKNSPRSFNRHPAKSTNQIYYSVIT